MKIYIRNDTKHNIKLSYTSGIITKIKLQPEETKEIEIYGNERFYIDQIIKNKE